MKVCLKCLCDRLETDFARNARMPDGLQSWCRECMGAYTKQWSKDHPERRNASKRACYAADPEKHKRWVKTSLVQRKYGLTLEEYDAILARGCAICGTNGLQMALDHDHASGKVRDALCSNCNNGLGRFMDDPARLRAAAEYLEKHR